MGQIPLSFPSVISPLAAADLFQIYSSRTEMRFWSNEYSPGLCVQRCKKYSLPKSELHPSPSHRTLESNADLPVRRCAVPARNKRFEKAALGFQGEKRGVPWLERATCWAQLPPGHGCSPSQGRAGRPTVWPAREMGMLPAPIWIVGHRSPSCSRMGALGREEQGVSSGNEAAKSRPHSFVRPPKTCIPFHRNCSLSTAK